MIVVCVFAFELIVYLLHVCVSVFVCNVHYVVFLQYIRIHTYSIYVHTCIRTYMHDSMVTLCMYVLTFDVKYTDLLRMYTMY